jgi:hypothetical protein
VNRGSVASAGQRTAHTRAHRRITTTHGQPRWRDRSETAMWLRWWRARISGYLLTREIGRRRDPLRS